MTLNQLAFSLGMEGNQLWITVLLYAVIFGGWYFVLMRPQQKKKKQEDEMRKSLQIGDEITTIGGIVGKKKIVLPLGLQKRQQLSGAVDPRIPQAKRSIDIK